MNKEFYYWTKRKEAQKEWKKEVDIAYKKITFFIH